MINSTHIDLKDAESVHIYQDGKFAGGTLRYKGYTAFINYDSGDKIYYGKIRGIGDLVTFECNDFSSLESEFHKAVDGYLEFCEEVGKEPDICK